MKARIFGLIAVSLFSLSAVALTASQTKRAGSCPGTCCGSGCTGGDCCSHN